MTLDNILEEIQNAQSILILTHESPDGDAIGSSLAMNLALKELGKNPDVIIREFPRTFEFLPGSKNAKKDSDIENYDLIITLDCTDLKRLVGNEYAEKAKKIINIDHHGSNAMYGDINFVNPVAPACCEILVGMLEYFNIPIDVNIGSCILAGIITDTGGFKYSSVTAETFEFTAELLRKGVNVSEIYSKVLETRTKSSFELLKRSMNRLELLEDAIGLGAPAKGLPKELGIEPGIEFGLGPDIIPLEAGAKGFLAPPGEGKPPGNISLFPPEGLEPLSAAFIISNNFFFFCALTNSLISKV